MFEESFSMIELNALTETIQQTDERLPERDVQLDELHSLLLAALDDALRQPEESHPASIH